jgi:gamma-glutamyltranspeptidase/glutathione hydrolase
VPRVERPKVDAGPERHEESSALVDMTVGRIHALSRADPVSVLPGRRRQIEATKLAYADIYQYVADPAAMRPKVSELVDRGYLVERARLIDLQRVQNSGRSWITCTRRHRRSDRRRCQRHDGVVHPVELPGFRFRRGGPRHRHQPAEPRYSFTLTAGHDNQVGPRKRPFHTIIPGFVAKDGLPVMSFGVMGGTMQALGHTQVMIRFADYRQSPQAVADAPRWRVDTGLKVNFEPGFEPEVYEELKRDGQAVGF